MRQNKKPQILLYNAWSLVFNVLPDEKAGQLIKAIFAHVDGDEVEPIKGLEKAMSEIFETIDADMEKYEQKSIQMKANVNKRYSKELQKNNNCSTSVYKSEGNKHKTYNIEHKTNNIEHSSKESISNEIPKKRNFSLIVDECLSDNEVFRNNPELVSAFKDFIEMRKSIKKPVKTERAVKLNIKDAVDKGCGDPQTILKVINQSVKNSWQGFYELKDNAAPNGVSPESWAYIESLGG